MGYRSDVCLVVSRDSLSHLMEVIPTQMRELIKCSDAFMQKNDNFCITWNYIKWHSEYGEIRALTNAFSDLDSNDYHFIRIGENREDIEECGGYWDNPFNTYVSRSINVDDINSKEVDLTAFM